MTTVRGLVVLDASILVDALSGSETVGRSARDALRGRRWAGPEHLRVETFHALRGRALAGKLASDVAHQALNRLRAAAIDTVPTVGILDRMWELRANLSGYDAAYVAAAEFLDAPLVTGDAGFIGAPGVRCRVQLVPPHAAR